MSLRLISRFLLVLTLAVGVSACSWRKPVIAGIQVQLTDGTVANVYLDELHLGQTPLTKNDLQPGTYQLRIEPHASSGKQPYQTDIHLYAGSVTSVLWSYAGSEAVGTGDILELEPLPSDSRAELAVITVPEGASVLVDNTTYGLSPVVLEEITSGDHSLTFSAVGHVKKTLAIQIQQGFRLHVFSRLGNDSAPRDTTPTPPVASGSAELSASPIASASPAASTSPLTSSPAPAASATPIAAPSTVAKPYVTIKDTGTGWLRVRSEASSGATEVARVNVGQNYPYKSTLNGWYEIEYAAGKTGWITGQYADIVR